MEKDEILRIINDTKGNNVKLSASGNKLSRKVLEVVCAFRNSEGGVIVLGVSHDKEIEGIENSKVFELYNCLLRRASDEKLMVPPVYLKPEIINVDGKSVVYAYVSQGHCVTRYKNRLFVRGQKDNLDITNNEPAIADLFLRRDCFRFDDVVLKGVGLDVIDETSFKKMLETVNENKPSHFWLTMSMQEVLQSVGLIEVNNLGGVEITVACLLLFGKEADIRRLMPEYGINIGIWSGNNRAHEEFRIRTNLIEAYYAIMGIVKGHIKDKLVEDNDIGVISVRDMLLKEVVVNMLRHNDYSAQRMGSVIIMDGKFITENVNPKRVGGINAKSEGKYSLAWCKNPRLEVVFSEMGLASAFGFGCKNIEKYSKMYSGKSVVFDNGYIFRVEVPL